MTIGRPHHGDHAAGDHALHLVRSVHAGIVGRYKTNGKTKFSVKAAADIRFPPRAWSVKNRGCAMIGFSVGGCFDCIRYLIVAVLVLVFLFGLALISLSLIRIINMTVFDADERTADRTQNGRDFGWDLMVDDVHWRRVVQSGERQSNESTSVYAAWNEAVSDVKSR
jgi:hypothetical protein